MKPIYTFLGLPASGKGTQAENFAKKRKLKLIGMGDLIREEIENHPDSPYANQIQSNYDKGIPQKDEIIFSLIKKKLTNLEQGVVFDNFPFSLNQAEFLSEFTKNGWDEPKIIYIKISPETSLRRISHRKVCPKCGEIYKGNEKICFKCKEVLETRSDDNEDVVEQRIKYYQPRLKTMLDFYGDKGRVYEINGEPGIDKVREQIEKIQ